MKPERDQNNRASYRDNWWFFGEPRKVLRQQLTGLPRYIATVETAKHRTFQFLDASILPDNKLVAIALSEAFHHGVLSSHVHGLWSLAAGSWLGVGNDPVYVKSRCFETFPFPDDDASLTPELRQKISTLAEQIDQHRKRVLGLLPPDDSEPPPPKPAKDLTLTGLYNVLQALREGRALNVKEKQIHTAGLVSVLKTLHDELDTAVLAAYGWGDLAMLQAESANSGDFKDELLQRLVAMNQRRAAEEAAGQVRWLRPAFQNPLSKSSLPAQIQHVLDDDLAKRTAVTQATPQVWPTTLPEQVKAVAQMLTSSPAALTLAQIAACFANSAALKRSLPTLLQTLEALGRAQRASTDGVDLWRASR